MINLLLQLIAQGPVDFANPSYARALTFQERVIFDAAFDDPRIPRRADVLGAEKVLAHFRCIGPMTRWRRTYSFGRDPKTFRLDTSLIAFMFIQAGHGGKPAGRRITTLGGAMDGPDDRQFLLAHGVYSIRTHLATVTYCGLNHPMR